MTMPSRISPCELREIFPFWTYPPAIVPTPGTRKVFRTSILPSTTSFDRRKHAAERIANIVDNVIDDAVRTNLNILSFNNRLNIVDRTDVKTEDDRLEAGKEDIGFRNRPDLCSYDIDFYFVGIEFSSDCLMFYRAVDICSQNDIERSKLAFFRALEQIVEAGHSSW